MGARRVEGVLGDDEQVARQAAQDDGAQPARAGLRIDVGVRREQADPAAAAGHDEVREGALRALRPGVLR